MIPAYDGFQYGVRFGDGSIRASWNGRTQRDQAEAEVERLSKEYAPDRFALVRRLPGEPWEDVPDPEPCGYETRHATAIDPPEYCENDALEGSEFCDMHDPDARDDYLAEQAEARKEDHTP